MSSRRGVEGKARQTVENPAGGVNVRPRSKRRLSYAIGTILVVVGILLALGSNGMGPASFLQPGREDAPLMPSGWGPAQRARPDHQILARGSFDGEEWVAFVQPRGWISRKKGPCLGFDDRFGSLQSCRLSFEHVRPYRCPARADSKPVELPPTPDPRIPVVAPTCKPGSILPPDEPSWISTPIMQGVPGEGIFAGGFVSRAVARLTLVGADRSWKIELIRPRPETGVKVNFFMVKVPEPSEPAFFVGLDRRGKVVGGRPVND